MGILISKPGTIIDIRNLNLELDTINLHPSCINDINKLVSDMLRLFQDIHTRTGKESYKNFRFLTNLFHAVSTRPIEKFKAFTDQLNQQ